MTGIVAHTYPEGWLKLTGQVAHWSTDYSGGKALLLVRRLDATSGFYNCGNEKRFVNIDTTTGLVSNFHSQTPFVKDKKPLTELPHN